MCKLEIYRDRIMKVISLIFFVRFLMEMCFFLYGYIREIIVMVVEMKSRIVVRVFRVGVGFFGYK